MDLIYVLCFLLMPAGMLWLSHHYRLANKIGLILLCYGSGLLLGNLGFFPQSVASAQTSVTEISVALALPLLLFSLNIRVWFRTAGTAILSLVLACTSVVTVAIVLVSQFSLSNSAHLAGMSVGVYTGGTPNLAAIKTGLNIDNDLYLSFHLIDTVVGGLYLLFMITLAIPLFRKLLTSLNSNQQDHANVDNDNQHNHGMLDEENYSELKTISGAKQATLAVVLSAVTVGIALAASNLIVDVFALQSGGALTIIFITISAMLLSLLKPVRELVISYKLGLYLIYIFCFTVATQSNLSNITDTDPGLILFVLGTVIGSLLLHALFCRLFRVDSDTFMITSVSAICSPPFVPMMAKALNNPSLIMTGMSTGIVGYALGNYLGISLGLFLLS